MAKVFQLQRKSTLALRRRKRAILVQQPVAPNLLGASYVEQFLTCGKAACSCHQGKKHGPYSYLILCLAAGQIRKFQLKTPDQQQQVRAATTAYKDARDGGEKLSQINAELLRRGERLVPD